MSPPPSKAARRHRVTVSDLMDAGLVHAGQALQAPSQLDVDAKIRPQARLHLGVRGGGTRPVRRVLRHLGKAVPGYYRLWENAWAEFVPFLRFDREIRTVICTTNALESINARLRRAVNARGHFPTEQAALKCLYMAIMSLDPTGKGRKRWTNRWKAALNAFDITFDGRLSAGRK